MRTAYVMYVCECVWEEGREEGRGGVIDEIGELKNDGGQNVVVL